MRILKKSLILILLFSVMLNLAACGKTAEEEEEIYSTGGHDLVMGDAADNVFSMNRKNLTANGKKYSMNPLVATNRSNQLIDDIVYENMLEVDSSFNVVPNIIKSWECNEDGTTWTFELDTENPHYFSDGEQVTGSDLRYSIERAVTGDRFLGRFTTFGGCSYTDTAIYVTLVSGNTQFVKLMNIPVIKNGTMEDEYPIGSGPYKFNEDGTKLIPNEYYRKDVELPLKEIYLVEYDTMEEIISAYEDSYIDIVMNDPSSYANLGYSKSNEIRTFPTTNFHYVMFNQESNICKYSSFRYAMNFAFDRENLAQNLMGGNGDATTVPMYPGCDIYPSSVASEINYDMERVASILDNAGIMDYDEDGKREYNNGAALDFSVTILVCSESSAKVGCCQKFKEDMEKIGVSVIVKQASWDDFITYLERGEIGEFDEKGKWKKKSDWDMYYGEIKLRSDFDISPLFNVDSKWDEKYDIFRGLNYAKISDTGFTEMIRAYMTASDYGRGEAFASMCNYLLTNGGMVSLAFERQQVITHRMAIRGVNPNEGNPMYDFVNWKIQFAEAEEPEPSAEPEKKK